MNKKALKRKATMGIVVFSISLFLLGCGNSKERELAEAQSELERVNLVNSAMKTEISELKSDYNTLQKEHESFQEEMVPYKDLSIAEAEASKLKAEQEKESIEQSKSEQEAAVAAALAQAAAESKEAKLAEEARGYETGISYEQLARTPDEFKNQKIKFTGKVLQVVEGGSENAIRLAVNNNYDEVIYCNYSPSLTSVRILENDTITIYGVANGLHSYTATSGATITLPDVQVKKIDQ